MLLNRFINNSKIALFILGFLCIVGLCSCSVYWTEGGTPNTAGNTGKFSAGPTVSPEDAKELDQIFSNFDSNQDEEFSSEDEDVLLRLEDYSQDSTESSYHHEETHTETLVEEESSSSSSSETQESTNIRVTHSTGTGTGTDTNVNPSTDPVTQPVTVVTRPQTPPVQPQPSPVNKPKNIEITDQLVCASLYNLEKNYRLLPNFSENNLKNFRVAIKYLCNNNAEKLKLLKTNSYKGVGAQKDIFVDTAFEYDGKDGSYLATATATTESNIKLDVFPYVSSSYCMGFDTYKAIYGEDNVKEVDFIKILNRGSIKNNTFNSKWCSFHIKSKPVLLVLVPEYKGVLIHNMYLNNKLFIELNYVVEPINLVKDFLAIGIAYNNPDKSLTSYSYRYMASVKTSLHNILVKSSIDKAKDIAVKRIDVNKRLNARFSK